jgi:O-antigen ligase
VPYHHKKCRPLQAAFLESKLLAFLLAFALLVSNAAAGLASRLAGGLAFAASAVLCALAKVLGFDSLDMLHNKPPTIKLLINK